MKLYLASFMEKQNFGPGKIISVTHGDKPRGIDVSNIYIPLTPPQSLIASYNEMADVPSTASAEERTAARESAGKFFEESYKTQLESFVKKAQDAAKEECVPVEAILPFNDGDTFCSWERNVNTHYRKTLAMYLERLGYEVVQN